jgi:acetylornithine deacetylase/succinyl-diaminopimelate desuccinylase-like protein
LCVQTTFFQQPIVQDPKIAAALQGIESRQEALIQDWIRLAEIPSASGEEQARAKYVRELLAGMGFSSIRTDEISNVIAERPGTDPNGPVFAFAAHMDTVFPLAVARKVGGKADGYSAPASAMTPAG